MKKSYLATIFYCLLFSCSLSVARAQDSYQPGFVILNDGTRLGGTIILYANAPWLNQQHIFLKDSAALAASPNGDVKPKKYKTGDIKYYQVGNRKFSGGNGIDEFAFHVIIIQMVPAGFITAQNKSPAIF